MKRVVVGGTDPKEVPELRSILQRDDGWSVRWLPRLDDMPTAVARDVPDLVVVVIRDRESWRCLETLAANVSATGHATRLLMVFLTEPTEAELHRLPREVEFVVAPLRAVEV